MLHSQRGACCVHMHCDCFSLCKFKSVLYVDYFKCYLRKVIPERFLFETNMDVPNIFEHGIHTLANIQIPRMVKLVVDWYSAYIIVLFVA